MPKDHSVPPRTGPRNNDDVRVARIAAGAGRACRVGPAALKLAGGVG